MELINQLSKYFEQLTELAIFEVSTITNDSSDSEVLNDLKMFILTRDLKQYFERIKNVKNSFNFNYDIPAWFSNKKEELCINDFKYTCNYIITLSERAKEFLNNNATMNKDYDLSLQILYRDSLTMDLWPIWNKVAK